LTLFFIVFLQLSGPNYGPLDPTGDHRLVCRIGNGVRLINEVKLRRARLVLGLVTTFGGSTEGWPLSLAIPL